MIRLKAPSVAVAALFARVVVPPANATPIVESLASPICIETAVKLDAASTETGPTSTSSCSDVDGNGCSGAVLQCVVKCSGGPILQCTLEEEEHVCNRVARLIGNGSC